jgi:hypothetical protein
MVQDQKQNPIQKRRRGRKRAKHLIDTPTIEVSKQSGGTNSGFTPLSERVIAETGNAGWEGSSTDPFDKLNMTPSFEGAKEKGNLGIMNTNRTNIKVNIPRGNLKISKDKSGNRPVNIVSDLTIAPNSLLRSKATYVPNTKGVFDPNTGGLTTGSELSSGGKFDKKVTGLNLNAGFKQSFGTKSAGNRSNKNYALNNNLSVEGGLNFNNLRTKKIKPYAKLSLNSSIGTDNIKKLKNKPFSANVGVTGSMSRTFGNKPSRSSDFVGPDRINPEHLTGSSNSLLTTGFNVGVKHKKSGISLNYSRSKNMSMAETYGLGTVGATGTSKENKISLKIPLGKIKTR